MIKLELSEQDVNIVVLSLGEQPYKIVAKVLAELQKQINEQKPKEAA